MKPIVAVLFVFSMAAAEVKLGKPLALAESTPIARLAAQPDAYSGKLVQVKGKVTEVCQMAGCWMNLVDSQTGKMVRIKVNDGDIVFPKSAVGKMAVAEGKFSKIEMSREQAAAFQKHMAEENGREFDPAKVKSGMTILQLAGQGAVILE
jgi:hypothetical protein